MLLSIDAKAYSCKRPVKLGSFLDFLCFLGRWSAARGGSEGVDVGWWRGSWAGAGCRAGIAGFDRETSLLSGARSWTSVPTIARITQLSMGTSGYSWVYASVRDGAPTRHPWLRGDRIPGCDRAGSATAEASDSY